MDVGADEAVLRIAGLLVGDQEIELSVSNSGGEYVVEASPDPSSWFPVATNPPSSGNVVLEKAALTNRYFRVLSREN